MMQRMMHMMGNLSTDMQSVKAGVTEAKETAQTAVTIAKDTEKQVSELQRHQLTRRDVQTMIDTTIGHKLLHQQSTTHHDMPTVLFGGMHDLSFEAAKDFIDTSLKNLQLPTPPIVYHKGDDFTGTIFAKFETLRAANEVVTKASQSKLKANVWCKKDLPLETRCLLSVLLGLRRQLINWGFNRRAIRVKDDNLNMTIEGKPILAATTCSDQVRLDWLDQTWKELKDLQDSAELKIFRAAIGSMLWAVRKCRPDAAGPVNLLQRKGSEAEVADLLEINDVIKHLRETADLGIHLRPIPLSDVRVCAHADASLNSVKGCKSQGAT